MNHREKQRRIWSGRLDVEIYTVLLFPLFIHMKDYKIAVRKKQEIQKYEKVVKVSLPNKQKVKTVGVDALDVVFYIYCIVILFAFEKCVGAKHLKNSVARPWSFIETSERTLVQYFSQAQLARFLYFLRR